MYIPMAHTVLNTFGYAFTRAFTLCETAALRCKTKATFVASLLNGGTELSKTKAFMK